MRDRNRSVNTERGIARCAAKSLNLRTPENASRTTRHRRTPAHVAKVLEHAGLPTSLVEALDDPSWDEIAAETTHARSLTGKDVGTPILHFEPPEGVAFFGPFISRIPTAEQAVELWDHVLGLARYSGFSELKRSLRERPQLEVFGISTDDIGKQEDWHQGSRRQKH